LSKDSFIPKDPDDRRVLGRVLKDFLKVNYPDHKRKLRILYFKYGMHRDYAESLRRSAITRIKSASENIPINWMTTNQAKIRDIIGVLTKCMETLTEAARYYNQASCGEHSEHCMYMALLVELQIDHIDDRKIINVSKGEAEDIMTLTSDFEEALIIAKAFNINTSDCWVKTIYRQVILSANIKYYEKMLSSGIIEDTKKLFVSLTMKYLSSRDSRPHVVQNMESFLWFLEDDFLRYELAKSAGFNDMAEEIRRSVHGFDDINKVINQIEGGI